LDGNYPTIAANIKTILAFKPFLLQDLQPRIFLLQVLTYLEQQNSQNLKILILHERNTQKLSHMLKICIKINTIIPFFMQYKIIRKKEKKRETAFHSHMVTPTGHHYYSNSKLAMKT